MTRWWVIIAAGLAVFMASVDLSITNVALPRVTASPTVAPLTTQEEGDTQMLVK